MGKFILGLVIGLLVGLVFADSVFPEGFNVTVEHWADRVRSDIPGR